MNYRSLKLVIGYLRDAGDSSNETASASGLTRRFAWVLETYRPDKGPDSYFDAELFRALIERYLGTIGHDRLEIAMHGRKGIVLSSLETIVEEPFENAKIFQNGKVLCFIETVPWVNVGGPEPYHDSYTVSVYVQAYDSTAIRDLTQNVAQALGAVVTEVLAGQEIPNSTSRSHVLIRGCQAIGAWLKSKCGRFK